MGVLRAENVVRVTSLVYKEWDSKVLLLSEVRDLGFSTTHVPCGERPGSKGGRVPSL